jgi:hypothetical protein
VVGSDLEYAHAHIVKAARLDLPVSRSMVDASGTISEPATRGRIERVLSVLVEHLAPVRP